MSAYQHIMIGLDLSEESQQIIDRVKALFADSTAKLSLCHVLEPISYTYGGDVPIDLTGIQHEIEAQAERRLNEVGQELGIDSANQHIVVGQPAHEMHKLAKQLSVDLLAVGSHGRHGLALIFGSTSNSVLHGANCDVLAIRVKEPDEE